MNAKKSVSIQQSFADIALRLKIPYIRPGTHDEDRKTHKGWPQQIGMFDRIPQPDKLLTRISIRM